MRQSTRINKALRYVRALLAKKLPEGIYYHDIRHTVDVYTSAMRYGIMERLDGNDVELLGMAGIFHDTGYIKRYEKNEPVGAKIAKKYMKKEGFAKAEIEKVKELIMATQMPQKPRGIMQQIMCDADLDNLGREDFIRKGNMLRREFEARREKGFSDNEWSSIQIDFVSNHVYFTRSAKRQRDAGKRKNIAKLRSMLKKR